MSEVQIQEGANFKKFIGESILASITEVIQLVVSIEIEKQNFMEVGCYLHRASPALMELQTTGNTLPNAMEILQPLYVNVETAKDLTTRCSTEAHSISDSELKGIIGQLESVVRNIGEGLNSIPSSTFMGHEYAEFAVRSISREMQNAHFQMGSIQTSDPEDYNVSSTLMEEEAREELLLVKETDLYSIQIDDEENSPTTSFFESGDVPRLIDFLRGVSHRSRENYGSSEAFKTLPQVAEYMEPLYETFFCPLTKKMMDDPVTIRSGVTYERRAINEWFNRCEEGSQDLICPTTGQKLESRVLNTNLALKTTIEEWKDRNEVTRIKVARAALSVASSPSMISEALKDLRHLGRRKRYNKVQMRNVGLIPLLVQLLDNEDKKIKCETLEILRQLAEDDEEGKEMIAQKNAIPMTIKMLASDYPMERHLALLFLLELSRSETLCEKIGSVAGAILILITMKYNKSVDSFAAEAAGETLKNLEKCPVNIKHMAENGLLDPLLNNLIEGSEEIQMEMVNYLGETVLGADSKTYVAGKAATSLVKMVHSGNTLTRKAAFKALVQISSYYPNSKLLVEAGILPVMIEEMFTRRIYNEPMDSNEESAAILANILESGIDLETLQVNPRGHTMASAYTIHNIIHMLKNSESDELTKNLVHVLLCQTKSPKALASVILVAKETDAASKLIELMASRREELSIASTKLLINLSPHMGHTIADRLCKAQGLPESLIVKQCGRITEKHAVWANLLSKIPHQNLNLNLCLLHKGIIFTVIQRIHEIKRGEARESRFASSYLEGLVGILVRFTTTLYDGQILLLARNQNITSVFTELLMRRGSDEIQRLAAIGLENLSSESIHLSRPPQVKIPKLYKLLPMCLPWVPPTDKKLQLCPIHRGACSPQTTFCLLESKALERLLACLDHENVGVVEAALSAICTLLDDKVDVNKSIHVLSEVRAVEHVLNVLREHKEEGVWQKSFWLIERFLMSGDESASEISNDRLLPSTLVSAFHRGDSRTRESAEKILRHLNKMPTSRTR